MNRNIDHILKHALSPKEEPSEQLQARLKESLKEMDHMKQDKIRKGMKRLPMAAAITLAAFVVCSGTAYAAWRYLTPQQVAKEAEQDELAQAFEGKDAILINEKQSYGGYTVTLLGMTSGKNLEAYTEENQVDSDKMYVVTAIENADGSPMPKTADDAYWDINFFASPMINGLNPAFYHVATLRGGYTEIERDGILYRITDCDSVLAFADRPLYFCVQSGIFYDSNAYDYDEEAGTITRNENYEGLNALFTLPIDPSLADPAAQEKYLAEWDALINGEGETAEMEEPKDVEDMRAFLDSFTPENIEQYAEPIADTRQVLTPDEEGVFSVSWKTEGGAGGKATHLVSDLFPDGKPGMCQSFSWSLSYGDDVEELRESVNIEVYVLNEDGTVTFEIWKLK